jgi:hypothetical protein
MQRRDFMMLAAGVPLLAQTRQEATTEIPADILEDKIRGDSSARLLGTSTALNTR